MKLARWKNLTEEEKNKLLKKLFTASALVFIVILVLLLMRCQGCSNQKNRGENDFSDGKGHVYGQKISGEELFNDEYGKGVEEYPLFGEENHKDFKEEHNKEEADGEN